MRYPYAPHINRQSERLAQSARTRASAPHDCHKRLYEEGVERASRIASRAAAQDEGALDRFEAFASLNGPAFYGLAPNEERITLEKVPVEVPAEMDGGDAPIVPFHAGETLSWRLAS